MVLRALRPEAPQQELYPWPAHVSGFPHRFAFWQSPFRARGSQSLRARVTWAIRAWPRAAAKGRPTKGLALPQQRGDAIAGREVFRSETFRNEGFWTEAVQLPQGIAAAKVTPLQALDLGLQIDADMLDAATKAQLGAAWRSLAQLLQPIRRASARHPRQFLR